MPFEVVPARAGEGALVGAYSGFYAAFKIPRLPFFAESFWARRQGVFACAAERLLGWGASLPPRGVLAVCP